MWQIKLWIFLVPAVLALAEQVVTVNESDEVSNEGNRSDDNNSDNTGNTAGPSDTEEDNQTKPDLFIVETTHGKVLGHALHGPLPILSFIDIPYGKFEEYFHAPVDSEPWENVHDSSEHEKRCPQIDDENSIVGEKDCLVLSIFTPSKIKADASVLFHIHDGNFLTGSGNFHIYGPEYIVPQGVILVLPNYRLGPLGFLCLQNEVAPGNAALKDLTLALEWIKNNIGAFGGDPDSITVSAEGTAGALVGLLALSPISRNLFSRAITESGSALAPWALDREPAKKGEKLIDSLVEESEESDRSNILQNVQVDTILRAASLEKIIFKPCLDKDNQTFLENTPWHILREDVLNTTFMIGSASKAGIHEATELTSKAITEMNTDNESLLPKDLDFRSNITGRRQAANVIRRQYFQDDTINENTREELALLYTDVSYLGPSLRVARPLARSGCKVYMYEFIFDGAFNREKLALNSSLQGAARGDIIGYVFVQDGKAPQDDTDEARVSKLMTDYWVNFIKTGEPSAASTDEVTWYAMTPANESILLIGPGVTLEAEVHPERMALWTQLYTDHFIENSPATTLAIPYQTTLLTLACALFARYMYTN